MYDQYTGALELKSMQKTGFFSGYASCYNWDTHQDRVAPGAFAKSLYALSEKGKVPKLLWQHDPKIPIGKWITVCEDSKGLYVEGQLFLSLKKAQDAYVLMKEGVVDSLSIGFETVRAKKMAEGGRLLQEIKLHEISLVTFPANESARINVVKQLRWDREKFIKKIDEVRHLLREDGNDLSCLG